MSSKHNRRARRNKQDLRPVDAIPLLIERKEIAADNSDINNGKTYEEANWAKLSPNFRAAHNRLRQLRGLPTIPPPKIDLYVAPVAPALKSFDPSDPEFLASAREFMGPSIMGGGRKIGFTINGEPAKE